MINSEYQKMSRRDSPYLGPQPVTFTVGRFGTSLMWLVISFLCLLSGATRLGLVGPVAHIDNSMFSHGLAAMFLVLGGCQFTIGLVILLGKFNQKAP